MTSYDSVKKKKKQLTYNRQLIQSLVNEACKDHNSFIYAFHSGFTA